MYEMGCSVLNILTRATFTEIKCTKWAVTVLTILTRATFTEIKLIDKKYGYSANVNYPKYGTTKLLLKSIDSRIW